MWKLPAMYVGPYAETDAEITLELWNHFKTLLNREDLWDVWNLEIRLLPHLVEMTMRGIRVDLDRAERTKQVLIKQEKEAIKADQVIGRHGRRNLGGAIYRQSFRQTEHPLPRTEKGAPSFTKSFLSEHNHDLAKWIVKARNLNKTSGSLSMGS